ncbi:alpha-mannosidase [Acrasis kona]|uniref:Alpha-mannosidase n=1 Tax=Acrasis kona TaxID=1008807 RepID=A0AAW2Z2J7_9EUKA
MRIVVLLTVLVAGATASLFNSSPSLEVFVLAHSHIDQGWLKTVGEYRDETLGIISSVVDAIKDQKHRKYVWGDTLYFKDWFEVQNAEKQQIVKELINTGRFEILGGGWIQNDEACPSTQAIINQMTVGHDYLLNRFNIRPRVAWQIDPFGHEGRNPKLYADMGFDAMVINRVHHKIKAQMKVEQSLEFIWKPNSSGASSSSRNESDGIMTHVLHTHYSAPQGFDFENPGVQPVVAGNVADRANDYVNEMKKRATHYRTNHLLVPFGDDFKFKDANRQFQSMDTLIEYINSNNMGVNIRYATASEYFDSLFAYQKEKKIDFPVVKHDFVPYADNEDSYWTGYYASLPNMKKRIREAENALQHAENAFALSKLYALQSTPSSMIEWQSIWRRLQVSREDIALVNHHDGITGTCRNHVYQDYMSRLSNAIAAVKTVERQLLASSMSSNRDDASVRLDDANGVIEVDTDLIVNNAEGHARTQLVTLRIHKPNAIVEDITTNQPVQSIITPNILGADRRLANSGSESNFYILQFFVEMDPLSIKKYHVRFQQDSQATAAANTILYCSSSCDIVRDGMTVKSSLSEVQIKNEMYTLKVNVDGSIESIRHGDQLHEWNSQFLEYKTQRSGSYIFRPELSTPVDLERNRVVAVHVTQNTFLSQLIVVTDRFTATYKLYGEWIDCEYDVQQLPGDTEFTTRFYAGSKEKDLEQEGKLIVYDGMNFVKRTVRKAAPHAGHYYPSTAGAIYINKKSQLTVLTAQTMAVTKQDHSIQFLFHRRLMKDDGRGMSQGNNDESALMGVKFLMTYQDKTQSSGFVDLARASIDVQRPVSLSFAKVSDGVDVIRPVNALQQDLQITSFQSKDLYSDDIVLRIRNLNPTSSAVLSLSNLFNGKLDSVRAKSLSLIHDLPLNARSIHPYRMQFRSAGVVAFDFTLTSATVKEGDNQNSEEEGVFLSDEALAQARAGERKVLSLDDLSINIDPFEIKTFVITLNMTPLSKVGDNKNNVAAIIKPKPMKPIIKAVKPVVKIVNEQEKKVVVVDDVLQKDEQVVVVAEHPIQPHIITMDDELHLWKLYAFVLLLSLVGFCSLTYCFRSGGKKIFGKLIRNSSGMFGSKDTILPYEVIEVGNNSKEH